jgi:hypothetical protein
MVSGSLLLVLIILGRVPGRSVFDCIINDEVTVAEFSEELETVSTGLVSVPKKDCPALISGTVLFES